MPKPAVLAYSGGLDTSVAVHWMIQNLGVEVVAVAVDVGQAAEDYEVVKARALAAGAIDAIVVDARHRLTVVPALALAILAITAAALGIIIVTAFMGLPMGLAMIAGSILYLLMRGQDMGIAAEQFLNGMYTNYIMLSSD